ncbi:hypothetical protein JKP75_11495 [Blastococcus sp. TML/M2B]|uniref:cupredoxin domain-containing protein n=1 Tax=unclassified Blastococcus TaxID=2619396 RepID=UPI00190B75DB|nr:MULTISPECIES: plastocyanin/azurin family copper-binding protein [unclassified Blastococcus]MBN1093122.1 hypothetical protein [Blastococcus sp. TML/M2B]MBN1096756.1 hypothetical protein [Blastococcus sp. TML/C7B]
MQGARATALAVLLLTAACSSGSGDDGGGDEAVPGAPTLHGSVGTEESPDAFEIALVDDDGEPVTELPAGQYNVVVEDYSEVHDFHLSGLDGGDVDEKTRVTGTGETTWVITFDAGEYRYLCDPHPSMNGRFTVS